MSGASWFVGLPVAGAWMEGRVPAPPEGIRRFHPEDLHLTVAFLGSCGEARAMRAWDALVWPLGAIDVSLGAVVAMGSPRRYSALSALLVEGREEVEDAMGRARGAVCAAAEVPADERSPRAHVTLARPSRRANDAIRGDGLRWAAALDLTDVRVRLDGMALYTWAEPRIPRLFRVVAHRALAPP